MNYRLKESDSYVDLGAKIRKARQSVNLTQLALAAKIKVCHDTISKIELGKCHPDILIINAIAGVINETSQKRNQRSYFSVDDFAGRTNPTEQAWSNGLGKGNKRSNQLIHQDWNSDYRPEPKKLNIFKIAAYRELGKKIRDYREDADLTQVAVARRVGVCHDVISKIELGKCRPDILVVTAIAEVINEAMQANLGKTVSVSDFIPTQPKAQVNTIEIAWKRFRSSYAN
jgi:transcriptional regulator with XRE-family HTH domain